MERRGKHDNQLPELYLARVVRATSNEGDLVLDPFTGSGTTAVAATALGRRYVGCEFSPDMGPAAMAVSSDTQLDADDRAHWREGLASAGQETAMDPTFSRGTRKLITPLDFAALQDIGWELESMRWPGLGASIALSPFTERGIASGSTAPADPGLHWVEVVQTGVLDVRITSDQPVTLRLWDSQGLVAGEMPMGDGTDAGGQMVDRLGDGSAKPESFREAEPGVGRCAAGARWPTNGLAPHLFVDARDRPSR